MAPPIGFKHTEEAKRKISQAQKGIAKPWNIGKMKPGLEATKSPTAFDIVWAAGLYEGEGTCTRSGSNKKFPRGFTTQASISQKDKWVLERCRELFGGSISTRGSSGIKQGEISTWRVSGPRARGFLMTIYKFLSPRRKEQVRLALDYERTN